MSKPFEMPWVEIGDPVYWFSGGNDTLDPQAAIVTGSGRDNITVNILSPTSYNFMIRSGVRHCDDPRGKTDMAEEGGFLTRQEYFDRRNTRKKEREERMARQEMAEATARRQKETAGAK